MDMLSAKESITHTQVGIDEFLLMVVRIESLDKDEKSEKGRVRNGIYTARFNYGNIASFNN